MLRLKEQGDGWEAVGKVPTPRIVHRLVPWGDEVLAGGGAGIKLGQHIAMPKGTPLCDVWLTLLKGTGIDVESHGDSTGVVKELAGEGFQGG